MKEHPEGTQRMMMSPIKRPAESFPGTVSHGQTSNRANKREARRARLQSEIEERVRSRLGPPRRIKT